MNQNNKNKNSSNDIDIDDKVQEVMNMGRLKRWWSWSGGTMVCMLMVQVFATGTYLLSKFILNQGSFIFAILAYRNLVAALSIAPFVFFFERGNWNKLRTWSIWFWLFITSLTGVTMGMGLYYYGLRDTTTTYAVNYLNIIPIVTFLLSIILRVEKVDMNSRKGKLKTMGAILCVAGALTISLYKGKSIIGRRHHHTLLHPPHTNTKHNLSKSNWTRGTLILVSSCFSCASWFLIQVRLLKKYPYKYSASMWTCIVASLQSTVIGLCIDRSKAAWSLGWDLQLLTIIYSGLSSAVTYCGILWAIGKRGPTYPPMFNPLSLVFVAILDFLLLGQDITSGIVVGTVGIVVGLYSFLWGKAKEYKHQMQGAQGEGGVSATATATATATSTSVADDQCHGKRPSEAAVNPINTPNHHHHHSLLEFGFTKQATNH